MKNIVFIGDLHLSDRQISTRVDDTTETCLEKLKWILHYAEINEADIISTGDMFTHTLYSNHTRYQIKKALRNFYQSGFQFWNISGNHGGDVEDRDPDSVVYRELGQFCLDGYVNFLGKFDDVFQDFPIRDNVVIRGYSAYSELNTTDVDQVVGLVCHHWIMDAFGDSLVVYPDDMKKIFPNLMFIVAGHDHAYHPSYMSRDGVAVYRPGSVMRTDSGKASDRIPSGLLLRLEEAVTGTLRLIWEPFPIECARPYSEVFYSENKQVDLESANALERFVNQMQNNSGAVMDIHSAVKEQLALVPAVDKDMIKTDLSQNGFMV